MKKILVFSKYTIDHPNAGGAEVYLWEILQRLKDYKITILTARYNEKKISYHDNITIYYFGRKNRTNTILIHIILFFIWPWYILKIKPDIVIENISVVPFFIFPIFPFKKIAIFHQLNHKFFFKNQRFIFGLISFFLEIIMILIYKKTPFVVVSNWLEEAFRKYKFKKIYKILCGVDKKYFVNKNYTQTPMVLYLGRIEFRKGLDLFLKTYPIVKEKMNVKYIVAGNVFPIRNIKFSKFIKNFQKQYPEVEFLGHVSEEKKIKLFSQCWLYVMPSRMEGYGISPIEANAAGTFVIANNVVGLNEAIKENFNGILIDCQDTNIFAEKIIEWLNLEKLKQKESACKEWAKKHNWDESAKKFKEIIESL